MGLAEGDADLPRSVEEAAAVVVVDAETELEDGDDLSGVGAEEVGGDADFLLGARDETDLRSTFESSTPAGLADVAVILDGGRLSESEDFLLRTLAS